MQNKTILILGGTRQALDLAAALHDVPGMRVITSLAGRTNRPAVPAGELRVGGFGGTQALAAYLKLEAIDFLIDATHPFAAIISKNAEDAARQAEVPRLMLQRPPWPVETRWQMVPNLQTAAARLVSGTRCFLTIGRQELGLFRERINVWFLVRMVDTPSERLPLENYEVVTGLPAADIADEVALMQQHKIDVLVTKNSGGILGQAKLAAATELGMDVLMIERPPIPNGDVVETVEAAMTWLQLS